MSEWISVEDRLPEVKNEKFNTTDSVLTLDHFNSIVSAWYQYPGYIHPEGWYADHVATTDDPLINITHWKPLPELPK